MQRGSSCLEGEDEPMAAKGFREKVTTFKEPCGEEEPRGLKTVHVHVQQSLAQLPGLSWAI